MNTIDFKVPLSGSMLFDTHTLLEIDAKKMAEDGIKFYLSENGVWLTKYVDGKYVVGSLPR